jgi:hypothetical protein
LRAWQPKDAPKLTINWDKAGLVSKTTPTLQVVVNPPLRPGQPLGIASYKAVKDLGAENVRYVPWLPYPRMAVAELEPPTPQKTSWDFSVIDPMTKDFLAATDGHSPILNFSTSPTWLYKTDKPVAYPADPNKVVLHPGHRAPRPERQGTGRLLRAAGGLVCQRRLHRRERRPPRLRLPLQDALVGGAQRGRL